LHSAARRFEREFLDFTTPCRGQLGDTADYKSALQLLDRPSTPRLVKNSTIYLGALCLSAAVLTTGLAPVVPGYPVTLRDFKLAGTLTNNQAVFTLSAIAKVQDTKGASLELLSGAVALTELAGNPKWHLRAEPNRYVVDFDRAGDYPIQLKFTAAVQQHDGWSAVDFHVAPTALQSVTLHGLADDTQFQFAGAARPERKGTDFVSYLPSDGAVRLSWKEARPETEGKLFYAAELLSQISVSPGLMHQAALFDFKVMQGEMSRVTLRLHGEGEVTRVQGDQVLSWNVEPMTGSADRRLVIQLNQPQKDQFSVQVHAQTPLGAFPQTSPAMQFQPDDATRLSGYLRVVNDGAVRLEIVQASGMSQISPGQFPETDATRAALRVTGSQCFAYRFSGGDFALKIQADQILPEVTASELVAYSHGENELGIDVEIELDIREAPLRELLLRVPKNYAVAKLTAADLNDYFLTEPADRSDAELRLVYSHPVSGRQLIQLRLERNQALGQANWTLPRIDIAQAKSVRGFVAACSDPGFRLAPQRTDSLTEIATAFFPRKIAGIQAAFRLNDPAWLATLRVDRLPQTMQADVFHLFSIGEGIAYGSSVINYVVSGAPVSAFKIELSDEYFNVEFTGKDIRNWQKVPGGYVVQLHTSVSGPYTLLASYERPFKAQGETLAFTGARPLDAQSEQGHTLIISSYQFQVKPVDVSAGLLPLEPGEVPSAYRLFFDAPILAAYRYAARPFDLKLQLTPLAQGDSLNQVVDRAALTTHISKEGQALTDARYFVKSRGSPNFRVTLPDGLQLWSATVNGAAVVPVTDGKANLIPLPQRGDPDALLDVQLKLAARATDPNRVAVTAPTLAAPVLLTEWRVEPDTGRQLIYRAGSLTPAGGVPDISGFAAVARVFSSEEAGRALALLAMALVLVGIALVAWRWTMQRSAHRFSPGHLGGFVLGLLALTLAATFFYELQVLALQQSASLPVDVTFLAPIQQAGSELNAVVENTARGFSMVAFAGRAWPALFAVFAWIYSRRTESIALRATAGIAGWGFLAWAALRCPNGAIAFSWIIAAFVAVNVILPAVRRWYSLPPRPSAIEPEAPGAAPASSTVAAWLIGGFIGLTLATARPAQAADPRSVMAEPPTPDSVTQDIRIEDKFALATAKIHWRATKGETLLLLQEPAVLTHLDFGKRPLQLVEAADGSPFKHRLLAKESGVFDIEAQYQLPLARSAAENSFILPACNGLINRLHVTVANADVDVFSPQAVSVQRETSGSNTVATLVLSPAVDMWLAWKPRSRDVKHEKSVFYADLAQLYAPSAGVIEGVHFVSIRPAQGELGNLVLDIPKGATVTDVAQDAADPNRKSEIDNRKSLVSLWRFDPDTRKLRVTLNPAQSRPFTIVVRTQVPTGPLPVEQSVGLITVDNAAGQNGLFGIAAGNEVQLDSVTGTNLAPINIEDFPSAPAALLQGQLSGLAVRRAFRYSDTHGLFSVKASPVEPDVRVESQNTLSLGEDRTVLAANATVDITRAGIFRLSFVMPAGFDVEAISGSALSHWTESRTDAGRVITLHFPGKTDGRQQFVISLAGPGVKATNGWVVPQLILREAGKQRGTLLIVPEQGMRLQAATRDGVMQLDPEKSGIQQKGVLAFRVLQTPVNLTLNVEQVEPWIQVTSLQHATINEAQVKITANLQYQIENIGLKSFHVFLPTNAEGVHFQGDQVADFLTVPGVIRNGLQQWEVKLDRRVIGQYVLQASYQTLVPNGATQAAVQGVEAGEVNLQRGFVTVQSDPRLQVSADPLPEALQPAEWQSIPRALQQDIPAAAANFTYRLVDASFVLPLRLERHEAARLLPAHVNNITFHSVVADNGAMLTQVQLEIVPGDKRLLHVALPKGARFWFAFVNENGVWPWREGDEILIPLEQQSRGGTPMPVELFYSCQTEQTGSRSLNLELFAPKFDLPLENITWQVSISDKWRVKYRTGTLQFAQDEMTSQAGSLDVQNYLKDEAIVQLQRTREAESLLSVANNALAEGKPQAARRAFQSAYSLSTHDAAFNEDARVQLHNIKLQQALIGLNVRQNGGAATGAIGGKIRDWDNRKEISYTQQDAKQILEAGSTDDNETFTRLAERLIQQQDAVGSHVTALRANLPQQGHVLTFKRALVVNTGADLNINLQASPAATASAATRTVILFGTLVLLALLSRGARGMMRSVTG
jgi:hypothetical protein